ERLIPPWSGLDVIDKTGGIDNDDISIFQINLGPLRFKWIAKHFGYIQNKQFQDTMIKGPFKKWIHTHTFLSQGINESILEDKIQYEPKFGKIGSRLIQNKIQDYLKQLFIYRSRILVNDLSLEKMVSEKGKNILISGSHGLIGSALIPLLTNIGQHNITRLVKITSKHHYSNTSNEKIIHWDPENKKINHKDLEGFDVIIHLAGENIFGRWTKAKKQRIFNSRVKDTKFLSELITKTSNPPSLLICASAIGYYGNNSVEHITEDSGHGEGFLSEICQKWEDAASDISKIGIRVINTRFGSVLSPRGGILQKLLLSYKLGLGVTIGNKDQYFNWVSIEDVIKSIFFSIINKSICGSVNIVSPNPVTNFDFFNTLQKLYNTKLLLPINKNITKIMFGQMSDELLSSNIYVIPNKLVSNGYNFFNPTLENALRFLLGKMELNQYS
ncbi:MAG: TIGR01777 family oxidoreductase, partial [Nitrososphaeraceae archaeon]